MQFKYIFDYTKYSLNESFNSKEAKKQFLDKGLISKKDYSIIKKAFLPKYVYWGCRESANPENKSVIIDSIYDITLWFEGNKQYLKSKDIYSYTYEEVRLLMNDPSIGPKKKKAKGQGDYEIVYEDDKGNIIVHVKDHTASVYWAHKYREGEIADGQWCTAAYNTDRMFKYYSNLGPIFIYILPEAKVLEHKRTCIAMGDIEEVKYYYNLQDIKTGKTINKTFSTENVSLDEYRVYDSSDSIVYSDHIDSYRKIVDNYIVKKLKRNSSNKNILSKIKVSEIHPYSLFCLFFEIGQYDTAEGPLQNEIESYNGKINWISSHNYKKNKDKFTYIYKIDRSLHTTEDITFLGINYKLDKPKYYLNFFVNEADISEKEDDIPVMEIVTFEDVCNYYDPQDKLVLDENLVKNYNIRYKLNTKFDEDYSGVEIKLDYKQLKNLVFNIRINGQLSVSTTKEIANYINDILNLFNKFYTEIKIFKDMKFKIGPTNIKGNIVLDIIEKNNEFFILVCNTNYDLNNSVSIERFRSNKYKFEKNWFKSLTETLLYIKEHY